ncbi:hypothetical protein [Gemella morbillorum]|uniref:hypothetical protein n=1 Tax=Gemella morbillorum TaxID=29391 RepID=UPI0028D7BD72|nr:hypothetical protein [Gemella morbillorum]
MNITEEIMFLFVLNGYFLIELVFFLVSIHMFIKRKNKQEKIWSSKKWKIYNIVSLLLEYLIVMPWAFLGFFVSIFTTDDGSTLFYFKLNIALLILTAIMIIVRFSISVIGWEKRRKYFKHNK